MGKVKTVLVEGVKESAKTSKELYEEKKKLRAEKAQITGTKVDKGIKVVSMDTPEVTTTTPTEQKTNEVAETKVSKEEKVNTPRKRGKKYLGVKSMVDASKLYELADAIELVKKTSFSSFDGTMEMHLVVKKTGISANLTLPHFVGKKKVIEVASEETIKKLQAGKIDFDVLLATAEMMPKLVAFAKVLGPKGLMPNPKNGTLLKSEKDADKFAGNSQTVKTEKDAPLVHTSFGKTNQTTKELVENANAVISAVNPKQIVKAYIKSTMSPSVKVAIS